MLIEVAIAFRIVGMASVLSLVARRGRIRPLSCGTISYSWYGVVVVACNKRGICEGRGKQDDAFFSGQKRVNSSQTPDGVSAGGIR